MVQVQGLHLLQRQYTGHIDVEERKFRFIHIGVNIWERSGILRGPLSGHGDIRLGVKLFG